MFEFSPRGNTVQYVYNIIIIYEKLDHIPSSCTVLMVHVVKRLSIYTSMPASQSQRWTSKTDSRPRQGQVSMLQSQEMNSTAQYSFRTSDQSWHDACYI